MQSANGRDGPGLNYSVIAKFRAGEVVTAVATDSTGTWYKLSTGAWILEELLELSRSVEMAIVTVAPTSTPDASA
jgi:uncharacterized protein YgiM (DUF1202 family)